jgi:two-component system, OmpR family, KDP operon response regulator KdpE
MKILLVEDDTATVETVKLCVEIYKPTSKVVSTSKGLEALKLLKQEPFNVAIIDLGLPDIDGSVVLERLRGFSNLPVVVFSARHNLDVIEKTREWGIIDYITKPFDYRLLLGCLESIEKTPGFKPVS